MHISRDIPKLCSLHALLVCCATTHSTALGGSPLNLADMTTFYATVKSFKNRITLLEGHLDIIMHDQIQTT